MYSLLKNFLPEILQDDSFGIFQSFLLFNLVLWCYGYTLGIKKKKERVIRI